MFAFRGPAWWGAGTPVDSSQLGRQVDSARRPLTRRAESHQRFESHRRNTSGTMSRAISRYISALGCAPGRRFNPMNAVLIRYQFTLFTYCFFIT
jgi:hypothetical protein